MMYAICTIRPPFSTLLRKTSTFLPRSFVPTRCITTLKFQRMSSTLPKLPVFKAIAGHDPNSTAVIHSLSGRSFTYGQLLHDVAEAKDRLHAEAGRGAIDGERVAFLVENSYDYVVTLLSILGAHAIALPLSPAFPVHELEYIMTHSQASIILSSQKFRAKGDDLMAEMVGAKAKHIHLEKKLESPAHSKISLEGPADGKGGMMLYTSGTTNRPKGVMLPESVMTAQSRSLMKAWNYSSKDHLLHVLPLHHIHGTINAVVTPLFAGSTIEFLFPFNAHAVWDRLGAPFLPTEKPKSHITFFTVVPTVYNRLLAIHPTLPSEVQAATRKAVSPAYMRLNISGSAALPTPTKRRWSELSSGNILLERYGMTEVGMALSCSLSYSDRVDGSVGWPLPSVEVRLIDTETHEVIKPGEEKDEHGKERDGEIQLRGPTIFKEYFRNPEATRKEFVQGDDRLGPWFKTGDIAVRRPVPEAGKSEHEWARGPMYFIRGRKSADIIKSGGEKVSALEVERELLSLPQIADAAVVAVPSGKWGQKVGVVLVLHPGAVGKDGKTWGPMDMRRGLKDKLAGYKIPQVMKIVEEIPKNAMGKINKKVLVSEIFREEASDNET